MAIFDLLKCYKQNNQHYQQLFNKLIFIHVIECMMFIKQINKTDNGKFISAKGNSCEQPF